MQLEGIRFDFNNMLSFNVGIHGVSTVELNSFSGHVHKSHRHLKSLIESPEKRIKLGLEWAHLPFQENRTIREIQKLGDLIAARYKNVLFLGIGGSYLGLKAAQDALCPPYYNEFDSLRKGRPRVYFEGNNMDPDTIGALLRNINPRETFVVVISKSGETTETKVALNIVEAWLKKKIGKKYGRHIFAITDPESGTLRSKVIYEQRKDILSFQSLPLLKGVGGRFSELNMGLLHLTIIGIKIDEILRGARDMAERCSSASLYKNPAYMYAVLSVILYRKKGKSIAIMMPFSEALRSTADWYVQLLAESLGKKYRRKVVYRNGVEEWHPDTGHILNTGRTPISCRGTNDLHSIHQNNVEGENNKIIIFIRVEKFRRNIRIPPGKDFLSGRTYTELINLAQEATEWALVKEDRPNCTIIIPEITPYTWGGLIFFFEMATAFEGELLEVNAFDQPGVEGYKNYMYYKLCKPGISKDISREIKKYPLVKNRKFII